MLQKNGEAVKFDKTHSRKIKEDNGGKTFATFQLVNSLGRLEKDGKTLRHKNRHIIESSYVGDDDLGNSVETRYYRNRTQKGKGGVSDFVYTPEFIHIIKGRLNVHLGEDQNENRDLYFFLMDHPRRAGSKTGDGVKRPLFYLVNPNVEAIEYAQKKEALSQMQNLLWNPENKMDEESLRTIAKALGLPAVDDMNIERVSQEIERVCEKNPHRFLSFKDLGGDTNLRATIQEATEKGILKFNNVSCTWKIYDAASEMEGDLHVTRKSDEPISSLVNFLNLHDTGNHAERIRELIDDSNVPALKKTITGKSTDIFLEDMTLGKLHAIAAEFGVTYSHLAKENGLIKALNEQVPEDKKYWTAKAFAE